MAVVTYDRKDLESLVGKKLTDQALNEQIPLLGTPVEEFDKKEITFEVFPNRPDLLSIEGLARALRGFLKVSPDIDKYEVKKGKIEFFIDPSVKEVRPCFATAVIRDVKFNDSMVQSIMQFQEKIHDTLGRKRRKVSIGIHDLDEVAPPFYYKAIDPKSLRFVPLDMDRELNLQEILEKHPKGRDYAFVLEGMKKYPIIVDKANQVLSFPPIINGELTKVTSRTKNLLLDITGTDKAACIQALNILCAAFADRGCTIESVKLVGKTDEILPDLKPSEWKLDSEYCSRLLGVDLTPKEIGACLKKMKHGIAKTGKTLSVLVPAYRTDILHSIDLVEDVAIGLGYMNFKPRITEVATTGQSSPIENFENLLRDIMIGFGFNEAINFVLTNPKKEFEMMALEESDLVTISNPRTSEYTHFRSSLLPSLLETAKFNARHPLPQKMFEVGDVSDGKTTQRKLGALLVGEDSNYSELRSYLEGLLRDLDIKKFSIKPVKHNSFIPGRVAKLTSPAFEAIVGEISPEVLNNFGIEYPVTAMEVLFSEQSADEAL